MLVTTDKLHVLLVEDDEDHAMLLMRCLEKSAVKNFVSHVIDGEQALKFIYAQDPYADREIPVSDHFMGNQAQRDHWSLDLSLDIPI